MFKKREEEQTASTSSLQNEVVSSLKSVDSQFFGNRNGKYGVEWGGNFADEKDKNKKYKRTGPVDVPYTEEPPVTALYDTGRLLTGTDPKVDVQITKEDVEAMEEKAWVAKLRDFDNWVINEYLDGLDDPAKKAWLLERYPEFFDRATEMINTLNEAKKKYETIKIDNPKSLDDLVYMFEYESMLPYMDGSVLDAGIANSNEAYNIGPKLGMFKIRKGKTDVKNDYDVAFRRGLWNTKRRLYEFTNMIAAIGSTEDMDRLTANRPTAINSGTHGNTTDMKHFLTNRIDRVPAKSKNLRYS